MTSLAERLARPEILKLAPFDIAAQANDAFGPDSIKLDANENPYPAADAKGALAAGLIRYPEPQADAALNGPMQPLYGRRARELANTRGADDAIDILVRALLPPNEDAVSICTRDLLAYAHFARLPGAPGLIEARLTKRVRLQRRRFLDSVHRRAVAEACHFCSPNNLTGNPNRSGGCASLSAMRSARRSWCWTKPISEFSETPSLAAEAARRPNLVVLKTLSKAYGLAGARVGALIGNPELVAMAARALPPYPLPSLSIEAALAALAPSRRRLHEERIARIKADRERLAPLLAASPIVKNVRSGGGNFLFLEVEDPAGLSQKLQSLGIRARFRPNAAPGGVRLTIGTEEENAAALAAFGVPGCAAAARRGEVVRETKETRIAVAVDLDNAAPRRIETGVPFYDHMLDQVAAHGGFSLILSCEGDLEIDAHHSIEDCAIAFGTALSRALADRRGVGRFGFSLPMDETEAHVLIDLSGRPYSQFEGSFEASQIGAYPTEMTRHVFRSLADSLGAAIHVRVTGENDHHKTEACFKAFGRALRQAVAAKAGTRCRAPRGAVKLAIVDVGCGNIGRRIAFGTLRHAAGYGDPEEIFSRDKVDPAGVARAVCDGADPRGGLATAARSHSRCSHLPRHASCCSSGARKRNDCLGIIGARCAGSSRRRRCRCPHMGWSSLGAREIASGRRLCFISRTSFACDDGPRDGGERRYGRPFQRWSGAGTGSARNSIPSGRAKPVAGSWRHSSAHDHLIPAMDLMRGKVVRLAQGRFDDATTYVRRAGRGPSQPSP
jgi:histidinol-phosphate aminotransferase/imidazoleglycerol-phosphate dehydratase/histidinol-phosphatase